MSLFKKDLLELRGGMFGSYGAKNIDIYET
jgi:hypothetical protein